MYRKLSSVRFTFTVLLNVILFLIFFIGCAGSRYQDAEKLYAEGAYDQLVQAQFECQDTSKDCFRLKYLQMESYYQLGDWKNTLLAARQASDRIVSGLSLNQINRVYLVHANILLENINKVGNAEQKLILLRELESNLYQAIAENKKSRETTELSQLQLLLTRTLLRKMDYYEGKNLEIIHGHIFDVISDYSPELISVGYDKYYQIQADFKLFHPDLRIWTSGGTIVSDREELLIQVKKLYIDALKLRKIPLYEQGFSEQIEGLLKNIDDFMKKLVI